MFFYCYAGLNDYHLKERERVRSPSQEGTTVDPVDRERTSLYILNW